MKKTSSFSPNTTRPVWDRFSFVVLSALIVFFVGQFLILGEMSSPDTKRIIAFSPLVSPLYPWLTFLFRVLFGADSYVFPLLLFQNLLNAWALFSFCEYLSRSLSLPRWFLCLFSGTFAACFIAQIFFTYEQNLVVNGILTEGLAFPLYFLLCKYFLDVLLRHKLRSWYTAAVLSFLLFNVRGQFAWVMVPLFLTGFLRLEKRNGFGTSITRVLRPIAAVLAVVLLSSVLTSFTNRVQNSHQEASSLGSSVLLSTAVYCSQSEDLALFADESAEKSILEEADLYARENEAARRYAPIGLYERFAYFTEHYDGIKAAVTDALTDKALNHMTAVSLRISGKLIISNADSFFRHCAANFLVGLVRSVTLFKPGFTEFALFAYLTAVVILILTRWRREELFGVRMFLLLALGFTLLNSLFVSFGVFALSRYMFYNLPVLYVAAEGMLSALLLDGNSVSPIPE